MLISTHVYLSCYYRLPTAFAKLYSTTLPEFVTFCGKILKCRLSKGTLNFLIMLVEKRSTSGKI